MGALLKKEKLRFYQRLCAAAVTFALTACAVGGPTADIRTIVVSYGQCGGMPCAAEQVSMNPSGPYAYTVYPHRRVFAVSGPKFSDVVQRLQQTPFFHEGSSESNDHGNSSSLITIFVGEQRGSEQVRIDEHNAHYAKYRAFTEFVLQPIRANIATMRMHEEETSRNPKDLIAVSITHGLFAQCYFYDARFSRPNHVQVRYQAFSRVRNPRGPYLYTGVLPFGNIRYLVSKTNLAALFQDYPTMGHDFEYANVQLTYSKESYPIQGPERKYWPHEMVAFISSVDRIIMRGLSLCKASSERYTNKIVFHPS